MTDFFALLDQPRQPWLDSEKLKQAFHEKSRVAHPDAGGTEGAFAQVNEAYQVLQDPKRRLQHLLLLEGQSPSSGDGEIAGDIADLFPRVAEATQQAERVLEKFASVSNALSRSLLQAELRGARDRCEETFQVVRDLRTCAEGEVKALPAAASEGPEDRIRELQRLAGRFAYLTRWSAQLEEKLAQLAIC